MWDNPPASMPRLHVYQLRMQTGQRRIAIRPSQQRKVSEQPWHRAALHANERRALKPVTSAPVARSCTRSTPSRPALATRIPSGETASALIPRFAAWMVNAGARAAAPFFPESRPSPAAGTCGPRGRSAAGSAFTLRQAALGPYTVRMTPFTRATMYSALFIPALLLPSPPSPHTGATSCMSPRQEDRLQAPSAANGRSSACPSRAVKQGRPHVAPCLHLVSCTHRAP